MDGMLIYIIVGVVVIAVLLVICCCCFCKKKSSTRNNSREEIYDIKVIPKTDNFEASTGIAAARDNEGMETPDGIELSASTSHPLGVDNHSSSRHPSTDERITQFPAEVLGRKSDSEVESSNSGEGVSPNQEIFSNSSSTAVEGSSHSFVHHSGKNALAREDSEISRKSKASNSPLKGIGRIVDYNPDTDTYTLNRKNSISADKDYRINIPKVDPHSTYYASGSPKVRPYYWADGHMVEPYQEAKERNKSNMILPVGRNVQEELNQVMINLEKSDLRLSKSLSTSPLLNSPPIIPTPDYGNNNIKSSSEKSIIKERNFKGPYGLENLDDMNNPLTIAERENRNKRAALQR